MRRHQLRVFRNHDIRSVDGVSASTGSGSYAGKGPPGHSDHSSLPSDDSTAINGDNDPSDVSTNYKTTNVEITSTVAPFKNAADVVFPGTGVMGKHNPRGVVGAGNRTDNSMSGKVYEQYSVNIGAQPMSSPRLGPVRLGSSGVGATEEQAKARKNRAAVEANRAAWGYTKVALLFFVSLPVTWVCILFSPSMSMSTLFLLPCTLAGLTFYALSRDVRQNEEGREGLC